MPLRAHDTVIGVLGIGSSSAQVDPGEVALLAAFGTQVATALERLEATVAQQGQLTKLEAAYAQQEALLATIRELATPVLPIYQGIIILPLIGHLCAPAPPSACPSDLCMVDPPLPARRLPTAVRGCGGALGQRPFHALLQGAVADHRRRIDD